MTRKRVALISTGGTIEKTYDELSGILENEISVLDIMLASLVLEGVELTRVSLMNKDSLDMTDEDHALIAESAREHAASFDGVVIVHGTDRLSVTGERIVALLGEKPPVPIVLTGAMRPYALRHTDAVQNMAEALLAVQWAPAGVYVVMHNRALVFPGVVKDRESRSFRRLDEIPASERSRRITGPYGRPSVD